MSMIKRRVRIPMIFPIFAAIFLIHGAYVLHTGIVSGYDTSGYARWSDQLIASNFDYAAANADMAKRRDFPPILYTAFVTLLALLKLVFGAGWSAALVAVNLVADGAIGALLVVLARRATGSKVAGITAFVLYIICFDSFHWVPFLLSDMSFALITFSIFMLLASKILGDEVRWPGVLVLATVGIFYRPTGMVLLPDLAWAAWLSRGERSLRRLRTGLTLVICAAIAATAGFAVILQDSSRWPFGVLRHSFDVVASGYRQGEVVSARFETYRAPPVGIADYMLQSLDRMAHFFAIGATDFSFLHWVGQLVFFVPCYALAAILLTVIALGRTGFDDRQKSVFLAAVGAIGAYAFFHGLVQVDYDWRYRLPTLPYLILLASGGAAWLERRFRLPKEASGPTVSTRAMSR